MIPKTIHYIWFGGGKEPELVQKCLESWKKFCPDYQIIRWDENSLDFSCNAYAAEAYKARKWSLATDFFRFKILYDYGGIYLDTDVELLKPLDDLLDARAYMGIESTGYVNTGSGFGAEKGLPLFEEILTRFESASFSAERPAIFSIVEDVTRRHGYVFTNKRQTVADAIVYPMDYFAPINLTTRKLRVTKNTYSIHHYSGSWKSEEEKRSARRQALCCRLFGRRLGFLAHGVLHNVKQEGGAFPYAKKRIGKIFKKRAK